ncbi:uncharacterized protein [Epargyreus clarus]|uniref:uncharacterized protein n=1 Tax=Epargyreus clarus TaxID=520877 RepID=UPI003C305DEB
MEEDNSDFEYVCQKCDETAVGCSVEDLTEHLRLNHYSEVHNEQSIDNFIKGNITFEESLTTADFGEEDAEIVEDKNEVAIPTFCCPYCESIFSSTTRLVCHLGKHVEMSIENGVICCENLFHERKAFVKHLQEKHVHRAINPVTCRTCGFSAKDDVELQGHINETHLKTTNTEGNANERKAFNPKCQRYIPTECPKCKKTFSNKYNMLTHMKNHNGEPSRFTCEKCNKSYRSRGSLTSHRLVVHEGALRFPCAACGEPFPSRTARDVHARLHSGLKPYACNYCGKSYRAKNTLDRHIEMHLDVRNYACHLCPKKFRKNTHLKYHVSTHEKK